jgi:hypothetical protein
MRLGAVQTEWKEVQKFANQLGKSHEGIRKSSRLEWHSD